jgi:hypothetical protein
MKTKLIFLILLFACFACGTNYKPVSEAEKGKITGEVKEVLNSFINGFEKANLSMISESCLDSPDFIYQINTKVYSYTDLMDAMKAGLPATSKIDGTMTNEKFAVIDNITVLYTANSTWTMDFKDGSSLRQDPWLMQILFRKIDGKWKILSGAESGTEKIVKASTAPKELNQAELQKQFLGTWKGETGKDTTLTIEVKLYHNGGFETNLRSETKGKTIMEEKTLMGYDRKTDKLIECAITSGSSDISVMAAWFTSRTKAEEIMFEDLSNPEKAAMIWIFEFKSPDSMTWTASENNKVVSVYTLNRIKK